MAEPSLRLKELHDFAEFSFPLLHHVCGVWKLFLGKPRIKGCVKVVACLLQRKGGPSAAGLVVFVAAVIAVGVVLQNR